MLQGRGRGQGLQHKAGGHVYVSRGSVWVGGEGMFCGGTRMNRPLRDKPRFDWLPVCAAYVPAAAAAAAAAAADACVGHW